MSANLKTSTLFLLISAFALGIALSFSGNDANEYNRPDIEGLLWPNPKQLRQFGTMDHHGQFFNLNNLQGQWSFLFFGYTHCPDVCPLTMSVMKQLSNQLEQERKDIDHQVIFVTVDPRRDNEAIMQEYIDYFDPDFIGLGGTDVQVQSLAGQIGVAYFSQAEDDQGEYLVDHSASIFMIDPEGRLAGILSAPHTLDKTYRQATTIIDFINKN